MLVNFLNLAAYRIDTVRESAHDYHVYCGVAHPVERCPHCQSGNVVGFGRRERHIKDLPMHGRRVGLYVDARRLMCRGCNRTFYEPLPELAVGREMTRRLVQWIGVQSLKRPFLSVAEDTGVDEKTVRNIFRDYVNELQAQVRLETPRWMGIDEIRIIQPRCVIANIENNTIMDLLPNRNKATVATYLTQLPGKEQVRTVSIDMWTPYRDAVQAVLPQARIVIDKFHVLRLANEAMERTRKALRQSLSAKQRRGLMHDRFVLLKRERYLTDRDRLLLDGWIRNYELLGAAYRLKESFFVIYEAGGAPQALTRYEQWRKSIPAELEANFGDIVRAWQNWQPHILSYFEHPITNAYTESLNNLIRVMNRLGRGYSFEALRAKILFTEGLHKTALARPKFVRRASKDDALYDFMLKTDTSADHRLNYGVDIDALVRRLEAGLL